MNQRREQRFVAEQAVIVTVLGDPEIRQVATIRNASGRGLAMEMPEAVAIGAALKIEIEDSFLLGEAVYCKGSAGIHLVGVELDQMLCGLTELSKRLQEFAAEEASEAVGKLKAYPTKSPQAAKS